MTNKISLENIFISPLIKNIVNAVSTQHESTYPSDYYPSLTLPSPLGCWPAEKPIYYLSIVSHD